MKKRFFNVTSTSPVKLALALFCTALSSHALAQSNLVLNPSFELGGTAPTSWTRGIAAVGSATTAYQGTNSLRIFTNSTSASQTLTIKSGFKYEISVWVHAVDLTAGKAIFDTSDKYDGVGQGQFIISAATGGWIKYSGSFTATNTSITLRMFTDSAFKGTVYFDQVVLSQTVELPNPWKAQDIGTVGITGSTSFSSGLYTIKGAGSAINGSADSFQYVHQISSGDCDIKINVNSLTNVANIGTAGRAGVMIRESLNSNARAVGLWLTRANTLIFSYRTTTGSSTANFNSSSGAPWLRLTRTGDSFKAYYSSNGTSWTQLGSTVTASMSTNAYIGMGLCSGQTNKLATAVISNVTATP